MPVVIDMTKWKYPDGKASFFKSLAELDRPSQDGCLSEILEKLKSESEVEAFMRGEAVNRFDDRGETQINGPLPI